MDADVLIVGAGPTGLMLANQLVRRGVRVTIIDRHSGPAMQTRALGVQARTMEIYAKLGIVERALQLGKIAPGVVLWSQGRMTARVPVGETGKSMTPYPYVFILGQDDNERILGEKLNELGGGVTWNTELTAIRQQPGQVTATLKEADGASRDFTAAWVAGCDGAHSAVRELNGITFPGEPYEHVFFVADVEMTGGMVPEEVNVYLWRSGFHLFFPMRGADHWRIVGILPEGLRDKAGVDFDAVIPSVRQEAGETLNFKACTWFSTYRIHHRAASNFRKDRCFVLGDAAHIHSPMGAQGMNTGLQDAYNLAWKLALVIQGRADAALLDSYEGERIPVARRLLKTTDRVFKLVVSGNPLARVFRTRILARIAALAMSRASVQNFAFRTISQIAIEYRESGLSETGDGLPKHAPRAGDRFPWLRLGLQGGGAPEDLYQTLDDTHFHLLVIGQPAPSDAALGMGDLLRVWTVPANPVNHAELERAGMPPTCFYLLRPDGYVGLCGVRLDAAAVKRYGTERLRLSNAPPARRAAAAAQSHVTAD